MNGASALAFIAWASLRNLLRRQLRRLREPRYLLASGLGVFYLVNLFWQPTARPMRGPRPPVTEIVSSLRADAVTWAGMIFIVAAWVLGGDEKGLAFTDAEIQFLFPAPLSRRQLVHYKLARTLVLALVSSLVLTVSVGRRVAPNAVRCALGAWLGVATLSLHLVAASLTRQRLHDGATHRLLRRAAALVVPVLVVGSAALGLLRVDAHWPARWSEVPPYLARLLATAPLSWASAPLAPAAHVAMSRDAAELARWLVPAIGLLALHYLWALLIDARFEQASLAAAERRGRVVDRMRRGHVGIRSGARAPFRLAASGHPAVAIYWKNLTASTRVLPVRTALIIFLPALVGGIAASAAGAPFNRELGAAVCALLAGSTTCFGVQVYRMDFRLDLANIDILRSFPLRGVHVALAEVLAPFTVLTALAWTFLAGAAALVPAPILGSIGRVPLAVSAMLLLPAILMPGLLVQNGAALLFPAWVEGGAAPPRGLEAIGQRLITLLGTLFVVSLMLAPAALVGGLVGAVLHGVVGFAGLPLAALAAVAVVGAESALGFVALGRAFERFDPGRS